MSMKLTLPGDLVAWLTGGEQVSNALCEIVSANPPHIRDAATGKDILKLSPDEWARVSREAKPV